MNKMFKYSEKEVNKNESRQHKRKRKHSAFLLSDMEKNHSNEYERKEKGESHLSHVKEKIDNNKVQNVLERDEWMNIKSFLPCSSNKKLDVSKVKKLDELGQSDRELNPYWKDGGNGIPQDNIEKSNNIQIMDVNWLKKSLNRAEEQALRDNRSLEEVAAERWGSLGIIQSMIAKAENMSHDEKDKSSYKRYSSDKNKQDLHKNSNSVMKDYLRSKSESKSRSRTRENGTTKSNYQSRYIEQQRSYQKPKDIDDFLKQTTAQTFSSKQNKNWKKNKQCDEKCDTIIFPSKPENTSIETNRSETNKEEKNTSKNTSKTLTEAEMNKLGAKIIKAELMGNNELAAELKIHLEQARNIVANNTNVEEKTIILTEIDTKDIARPIQHGNRSKAFSQRNRKKQIAETRASDERACQFVIDDKYSLQKIFQRETGILTKKSETLLTETVSKSADYANDINICEQQNAVTDTKQIKRDYTYVIKEYQDSSKHMENCSWCLDSKNVLKHMIVTMDSMICLSLPAYTSLTTNHCILTPMQHIACQLQLDEDIWERLKELKAKLIKMFTSENLYPVFFEVYKRHQKYSHMQVQCIPLPKEIGELAPMYFKKALLECEFEWSVNKKLIDLKCKSIRHAIPNGLSYFAVEFALHPGYAHVIENEEIFPKNFAEEIIGGMLDSNCNLWRKPKIQSYEKQILKVLKFTDLWKKYNSLDR